MVRRAERVSLGSVSLAMPGQCNCLLQLANPLLGAASEQCQALRPFVEGLDS